MKDATDRYQHDSDKLALFFEDNLVADGTNDIKSGSEGHTKPSEPLLRGEAITVLLALNSFLSSE